MVTIEFGEENIFGVVRINCCIDLITKIPFLAVEPLCKFSSRFCDFRNPC